MTAEFFTLATPDGPFSVIAIGSDTGKEPADQAVVLASGWSDSVSELTAQIHSNLRPQNIIAAAPNQRIKAAVDAYYTGDFSKVNTIAVQQKSGPFRNHAWDVLRKIPAGQAITYSQYAQLSGKPQAVRAAASACARNAAGLFVPCHRVVRLDGGMGGFRWGVDIKKRLLAREATQ